MYKLEIKNVSYLYSKNTPFEKLALSDVSVGFEAGKITGLIGHTGSGKSTLVNLLNGLYRPTEGTVLLDGRDIWEKPKEIAKIRAEVGLVMQYPEYQLFDETVRADIGFAPRNLGLCAEEIERRVAEAIAFTGIGEELLDKSPFELSGGMRQRIVIAIALAANPDILICDEPTTALDVTIQSQILELINKLKKERNLTVIFITHDLGVVANMADRIAVMYAGKIVEYGTSEDVFYHSAHPYTWALLSSMPDLDTNEKLDAIPGTPPNMIYPPVGDAFAERNKYAMKIDFELQPPMFKISDTHYAATWLLHPNAPKIDTPKIITDRIARMKKMKEAQENGKQ